MIYLDSYGIISANLNNYFINLMAAIMSLKKHYDSLQKSFKRHFQCFFDSLKNPKETQERMLFDILSKNAKSQFGKEHNFSKIKTYEDFQKIPLREYEGFSFYIDKILKGEKMVLTEEEVINLQPTSGSISGTKLIPFTKTLKQQFQRGIFTWLYDLFETNPRIKEGRFYWSITPFNKIQMQSQIPIGFGNDLDYFDPSQQESLSYLSAVPFSLANGLTGEECRRKTLKYLCSASDLSFVSVWSPTFLSTLVDGIDTKKIWENLDLISCWTDGNSYLYVDKIKELFPQSKIQGKGLMSTEAISSIPLSIYKDPLLAINSHFFEFKDAEGNICLSHQTKKGKNYEIIITTGGGLYRYATSDIVEVTGELNGCPSIRFVGRENNVSDYVGEKLNELHVAEVIKRNIKKIGIAPEFIMLSPEQERNGIRYYLHIKVNKPLPKDFSEFLEKGLRENFYYDHARNVGQVYPLSVNELTMERPQQAYINQECKNGKREGSIKQLFLNRSLGWKEILK